MGLPRAGDASGSSLVNTDGLQSVAGSVSRRATGTVLVARNGSEVHLDDSVEVDALLSHDAADFEVLALGEAINGGFRLTHVTPLVSMVSVSPSELRSGELRQRIEGSSVTVPEQLLLGDNAVWSTVDVAEAAEALEAGPSARGAGGVATRAVSGNRELIWLALTDGSGLWPGEAA